VRFGWGLGHRAWRAAAIAGVALIATGHAAAADDAPGVAAAPAAVTAEAPEQGVVGASRPALRYGETPEGVAAFAEALDLEPVRIVTVQNNGRRKPLDTFAREQVKALLGKPVYAKQDPLFTYLWMLFDRNGFAAVEAVKIRNHKLVELLGMELGYPYASFRALDHSDALSKAATELHELRAGTVLGPNQGAIQELSNRVLVYQRLGDMLRVLPTPGARVTETWRPLTTPSGHNAEAAGDGHRIQQELAAAFATRDAAAANLGLAAWAAHIREAQGDAAIPRWKASAEALTNSTHPLGWAWKVLALAAALLGLSALGYRRRLYPPALVFLVLGLLLATTGLTVRTIILERAPVANIYEATVFATFAAVLVGTVFELIYRNVWFGASAAVFGTLAFMLADLVPAMDQSIGPIQAVLRSYWLNIHVTCMLFSYGTFAIAFVLAIVYAGRWFPAKGYPRWSVAAPILIATLGSAYVFLPMLMEEASPKLSDYLIAMLLSPTVAVGGAWAWVRLTGGGETIAPTDVKPLRQLERNMYRVVQVGFVLLTTGIILGAVWANESWGRYWGWDPKETWAFITWVIYGAFIHGYIAGWFRGVSAAVWQVLGFYAVLFTFFGVSFVLDGLHSYLQK
jgi:cytochrome c-type biogenesis protein CcsB